MPHENDDDAIHASPSDTKNNQAVIAKDEGRFDRMLKLKCFGRRNPEQLENYVFSEAKNFATKLKTEEQLSEGSTVTYGTEYKISLSAQTAKFYRIIITKEDLEHGVIIWCRSSNGDKFKVLFFDENGEHSMSKESEELIHGGGTEGNFLFLPFTHYDFKNSNNCVSENKELPAGFSMLEFFNLTKQSIVPGTHLFCVYQNNSVCAGNFTLSVLKVQPEHGSCISRIKRVEKDIQVRKEELNKLKLEYVEFMEKKSDIKSKVEKLTPFVSLEIEARSSLYEKLFESK